MTANISAIFPYYNEENSLPKTLQFLSAQTLEPKEVLFVDSSSTDGSGALLDRWITENQNRFKTTFLNIHAGTNAPGSSKNAGIRKATGEWIAFMDCGLIFDQEWLQKQWAFVQRNSVDIALGVCTLSGVNTVDQCAVAQQYGYKRLRPCVPSTLVRKSVFDKTGLFLENRRAGYDMDWLISVRKLNISLGINTACPVRYLGVNYAPSLVRVFKKSLAYAIPTVGMRHYTTPYYYLLLLLTIAGSCAAFPRLLPVYAVLYLLLRGYLAPFVKSKGARILVDNPLSLIALPLVALVFDVGRTLGIIAGTIKYHILRR